MSTTKQDTAFDPIRQAIQTNVDAGHLAGAATLVWRGGSVVQRTHVGLRDLEAALPVERNTIFRIASLTKPITTVAALMLLEEGRLGIDTPITRVAPEPGFHDPQHGRTASDGRGYWSRCLERHRRVPRVGVFNGADDAAEGTPVTIVNALAMR